MAIKMKMIGGQWIPFDSETGELLVKVSGVTLDADIDIGDVNLLDTVGSKVNPATEDKQDSILSALTRSHIAGPTKIAVDATPKTLSELELTLNENTRKILITVWSSGIFYKFGPVTVATGTPLLMGVHLSEWTKAKFDTLQFVTDGDPVDMSVTELG